MIITVSGWSGVGSTTLALLLAKTLNYKLLSGTETFRYLGSKLNYEDTGADRVIADAMLEKYWGPVYDMYLHYKANTSAENIIIESDLIGFFTKDREDIISVFLIANFKSRSDRLKVDKRDKDVNLLKKRDEMLKDKYHQMHNIDIFDKELLKDVHDLVLDNTSLSLSAELNTIYNYLEKANIISKSSCSSLLDKSVIEDTLYWEMGKAQMIKELTEKNLLFSVEEIFQEIIQIFPHGIKTLPENLVNIIMSSAKAKESL
jgi:cytidylate kinase